MNPKRASVQIGGKNIGPGHPVFIVVETGTTCNGDIRTAIALIDAAKDGGADAIKFMVIDPDYFMSDKKVVYSYSTTSGQCSENMHEMFQKLKFTPDEWAQIRTHCQKRGIIFYATVDYVPGVDLMERLDCEAYKLSSWDARHFPLIRQMSRTGKPIVIDLGPTHLTDIADVLRTMREENNPHAVLLHCTHAKVDEEVHLQSIPYLERTFHCPAGFSADSRDFVPDLGAVALGARIIEKRLTLNKDHRSHHHDKALEPKEFAEWVAMIRRMEALLGQDGVSPSSEDLRQRELYFVSLVADCDIPAGTTITENMIACKRPGTGLDPALVSHVIGRTAQVDISENALLSFDMLCPRLTN